jgi:hypothetical protein
MWGTQHSKTLDVATVEQFACNEGGLNGLADTNVIGDEQAYWIELEGHKERYELIGPGLDGDLPKAAKRARAATKREQECVTQEKRCIMACLLAWLRARKRRISYRICFESDANKSLVFLGAGNRTNTKRLRITARKDDPLSAASANQTSWAIT